MEYPDLHIITNDSYDEMNRLLQKTGELGGELGSCLNIEFQTFRPSPTIPMTR
jgi:hypothetical protein